MSRSPPPPEPLHVAVSRCLLGERVRHDGRHKGISRWAGIPGGLLRVTGLCPEVEAGFGTPREPMALVGAPGAPTLRGLRTGQDHTAALLRAAEMRLLTLAEDPPELFVLKARSPSCGVGTTPRGDAPLPLLGDGLFAEGVARVFPDAPRMDEVDLENPGARLRIFEALVARRQVAGRETETLVALFRGLETWSLAVLD